MPELAWPDRFAAIDAAPLWQSLARIVRSRTSEIVAVLPTVELAQEAAAWAQRRAERFVGGQWVAEVESPGAGERSVVRLTLTGEPDITDIGRPVTENRRRRRPGAR